MSALRSERGSVLITATAAVAMMLVVGVSLLTLIDRQQIESGKQRTRESSLNLNEGVLYSQAFVLARNWPTASNGVAGAFPASCVSGAATTTKCPDRNTLALANSTIPGRANFKTTDFTAGATWVSKVRDNGGPLASFFDPGAADAAQPGCPVTPCTLDANGDRRLWVQVRTVVRERPRSIAALLQLELFREAFPQTAITAGSFEISNQGNHGSNVIIDNSGAQIAIRCDPTHVQCADYNSGQISAPSFTQLPSGGQPALNGGQLERLRARAILDGRYFDACPPNNANLAGPIVWVENCDGVQYGSALTSVPCEAPLTGNCINQPTTPGTLIWHKGRVSFAGNQTFVGLVYSVNDSDGGGGYGFGAAPVLSIEGGFAVYGSVTVDGNGGLKVGSNARPNLKFDPNVFKFGSYGTAGLVQNTWRELPAGS